MFDDRQHNGVPAWLGGLALAIVLIAIGLVINTGNPDPVLVQQFAPQPTDPNAPTAEPIQLPAVQLPELAPDLRDTITGLRDRFAGGEPVPALTPVATGVRARVEVNEVRRAGDTVQVRGTVYNIADQPVAIPPDAFSFRDSQGVQYSVTGSGGATIQPGDSSAFELSVPLPHDHGLVLILSLPPDPPIEQTLLVATQG